MRSIMLVFAASLSFLSLSAIGAEGPDFDAVASLPCKSFIAIENTSLVGYVLDPLLEKMNKLKTSSAFFSACVIDGYVYQLCKVRPDQTVGAAFNALVRMERNRKLPPGKVCGA